MNNFLFVTDFLHDTGTNSALVAFELSGNEKAILVHSIWASVGAATDGLVQIGQLFGTDAIIHISHGLNTRSNFIEFRTPLKFEEDFHVYLTATGTCQLTVVYSVV